MYVGVVGFVQPNLEVVRGVHLSLIGEALRPARSASTAGVGGWASVSWFFLPHLDARFDFVHRSGLGAPATTTYLAQLHGYL
jgi:hypothetical protein